MSNRILYTCKGGQARLGVRIQERTIRLTALEIRKLFQRTKQSVSMPAKNIFK